MQNIGKIVQIIGAVVDVRFPKEKLPRLLNAITVDHNGTTLVIDCCDRCAAILSASMPSGITVEYFPGLVRQSALR